MDFCRSGRIRRIYWIPLFVSACHAVPAFFLYRLSMQSLAEPGTEENPYQKGNSACRSYGRCSGSAFGGSVDSAAVRPGAGEGTYGELGWDV